MRIFTQLIAIGVAAKMMRIFTKLIVIGDLVKGVAMIGLPVVTIMALNELFHQGIELNFWTWCSMLWLLALLFPWKRDEPPLVIVGDDKPDNQQDDECLRRQEK